MEIVYGYAAVISLIAFVITCRDKLAAKHGIRRTPEKVLFAIALLGGSGAMYLTMLLIRHKTKHKRFMLGLPLILATQVMSLILFLQSS